MRRTAVRICLVLIAGVLFQYLVNLPDVVTAAAVIVTLLLSFLESRSAYLTLLFLAALNTALHRPAVAVPADRRLAFEGYVIEEELFGNSMRLLVKVTQLNTKTGGLGLPQEFHFYHHDLESRLGEKVLVTGFVRSGSKTSWHNLGTVSGQIVFQGIAGGSELERRLFFPLRRYFRTVFEKYCTGENSRLAAGLLIGGQSGLTANLKTVFANAGVTHVLAVSGLHITYIVGLCYLLLKLLRVPRRPSFILIGIALVVFAGVTAFRPSVMRATLMGLMLGMCGVLERKTSLLHVTTVSLIILLFFDPSIVFSVSAQLSYGAVYGILLLMPVLEKRFPARTPRWLRNTLLIPLAVSLSAQLFTSPLLIYYFNRLPTLSLFANLIVVPLSSLAVTLGFLVAACNLVSSWLAGIFGGTLELVLRAMIVVAQLFGGQTFSVIKTATPSLILVAAFYSIFAPRPRWRPGLILFLVLLNGAIWVRVVLPRGMSIHRLEDRNYLVEMPSGRHIAVVGQASGRWPRLLAGHGADPPDLVVSMPRLRRDRRRATTIQSSEPGGAVTIQAGPVLIVHYGETEFEVGPDGASVATDGRTVFRGRAGLLQSFLRGINFLGIQGRWPRWYTT